MEENRNVTLICTTGSIRVDLKDILYLDCHGMAVETRYYSKYSIERVRANLADGRESKQEILRALEVLRKAIQKSP